MRNLPSIQDYVECEIGRIFSENGVYEPGEITFTLYDRASVEIGDIVCIEHPSKPGVPVFYQVVEALTRRKARDLDEDLIKMQKHIRDEARDYPRAKARQLGYYEELKLEKMAEDEDLLALIEHVIPLEAVYKPKDEVLKALLEPADASIGLGLIYPGWKHTFKLNARKLLRRGMLVVGGVGTGKTTTMLTTLTNLILQLRKSGGKPRILIVDKDGEYGAKELIDASNGSYVEVDINDVTVESLSRKEEFARVLLQRLGFYGKQSKAAKALYAAVMEAEEEKFELSPEFVKEKILPRIMDPATRGEIEVKLQSWNTSAKSPEVKYTIDDVLTLVKTNIVTHLNLKACRNFDHTFQVINELVRRIYDEAIRGSMACVLVIDEAHLFCPEKGGIELSSEAKNLRETLELVATTGPRNNFVPFMATQRPSLISKTITTQLGQNIIAHRVEDVDLGRLKEIMGPVAEKVSMLPRGWALVKSISARIREPLIIRVEPTAKPTSATKTAYERFLEAGAEEA